VTEERLRMAVRDFVDKGFVKAETVEAQSLTKKYSFAENENIGLVEQMVKNVVEAIYPSKSGVVLAPKRTYLTSVLNDAVDKAVAMNPELLGKDYLKLQTQLETFAVNKTAKSILKDLEDVSKFLSEGNVLSRIDNLERSSVSTFLGDLKAGQYDLLIDYDFVQRPEMRASRHDAKDVILDKVTREMTGGRFRDYADLKKGGNDFEVLQVAANANFLLIGGVLEKALIGSFGIKPKDMAIIGKQWGFADPDTDGLYFIATDTDVVNRGTLGWGMCTADYDGARGFVMFRDYVDPKLTYDIERLEAAIADPFFEVKKMEANRHQAWGGLGVAGLGYKYVQVQEQLDDASYGVVESLDEKRKTLDGYIKDIVTYRRYLTGLPSSSLLDRL